MTDKEKLEKAVEFIKSIEKLNFPVVTTTSIVSYAHAFCEECGEECKIDYTEANEQYVNIDFVKDIKDKAWHLLADLT